MFTVTDTRSSGVLAGFGVSCELCPRGSNQAVVCQLLYTQIPGSTAINPIFPWWDPLVAVLPGAICGEDQRLWRGCDAWEETNGRKWFTTKQKQLNATFCGTVSSLVLPSCSLIWVNAGAKKTLKQTVFSFVFNVASDRNWLSTSNSLPKFTDPLHKKVYVRRLKWGLLNRVWQGPLLPAKIIEKPIYYFHFTCNETFLTVFPHLLRGSTGRRKCCLTVAGHGGWVGGCLRPVD